MRVRLMNADVLRTWIEDLGLTVKPGAGASGTELHVTPADADEPGLVVRPRDPGAWEVVHERQIPASIARSTWQAPWDTGSPAAAVDKVVRQVACGFPLVEAQTRDDGGDIRVWFRAPVFTEGLARQALTLTVSSVLKAAAAFDLITAQRAEELKALREFDAEAEQRAREQQKLIGRMSPTPAAQATAPMAAVPPNAPMAAPAAAPAASPTAAWTPSHEMKRRAQAWAQPDPNAAVAVAGTLQKRVPVQVLERRGDWAHIKCSNGWSAWIDAGGLKAR
jgi:Bacterial SH3 domain